MENIVIFIWIPIIILLGRYFKLSNISYTIITLFMMLHLFGAHYNYGSVPFGETIGEWMGGERNQFDRFMHLFFGLLIVYPIHELFVQISNLKGFWGYFFSINIIMSLSAVYEIFEWLGVANLPAKIGYLFIGGNDPWDAEKDMALAGVGAVVTVALLYCFQTKVFSRIDTKSKNFFPKNSSQNM